MTYMTVCLRSQSPLISPACQSQPDNGRDILSAQRDPPPHMTAIDSDFRRSSGPFPMRSRRISCPQLAARKSALAVPEVAARPAGCLTVGPGLGGGGLRSGLLVKPREFSHCRLLRGL